MKFPLRARLVSMRMLVWLLASLRGLRIRHCCELWRRSPMWLDLAFLWLWLWPAAAAPIQPLARALPYAVGVALKSKQTNKQTNKQTKKEWLMLRWTYELGYGGWFYVGLIHKATGSGPAFQVGHFPLCQERGGERQKQKQTWQHKEGEEGPRHSASEAVFRQFISFLIVQWFPMRPEILHNTGQWTASLLNTNY